MWTCAARCAAVMVALAHRQQLPGPATVSLDGLDSTVMCPTSHARILLPGRVRKWFLAEISRVIMTYCLYCYKENLNAKCSLRILLPSCLQFNHCSRLPLYTVNSSYVFGCRSAVGECMQECWPVWECGKFPQVPLPARIHGQLLWRHGRRVSVKPLSQRCYMQGLSGNIWMRSKCTLSLICVNVLAGFMFRFYMQTTELTSVFCFIVPV